MRYHKTTSSRLSDSVETFNSNDLLVNICLDTVLVKNSLVSQIKIFECLRVIYGVVLCM